MDGDEASAAAEVLSVFQGVTSPSITVREEDDRKTLVVPTSFSVLVASAVERRLLSTRGNIDRQHQRRLCLPRGLGGVHRATPEHTASVPRYAATYSAERSACGGEVPTRRADPRKLTQLTSPRHPPAGDAGTPAIHFAAHSPHYRPRSHSGHQLTRLQ